MRILFTFVGGSGHFLPLVPLARAAQDSGHRVAFACGRGMAATVEAEGFQVFPLGANSASPSRRMPLRPIDAEREVREFCDKFARAGAQTRAPLIYALCKEYEPDVLVCDETDFGGLVAAEKFGIPYASVIVLAAGSFVPHALLHDALAELRAQNDLPPDPALEMLYRHLVLSPVPPSFRDPAFPLPATAFSFRPFALPQRAPPSLPHKFAQDAPPVYFSLGTVFNAESGDLFARVLDGLRALPVNVIVTVGEQIDPAEFGRMPANIRVARYIAQEAILPHCELVVSHGGSGSVLGALAHGLPMVLLPMGADQPSNAARCAQLRVGEWLDPVAATSDDVRAAVSQVLAEPTYRRNAERLRDEFAELPDVRAALGALAALVNGN